MELEAAAVVVRFRCGSGTGSSRGRRENAIASHETTIDPARARSRSHGSDGLGRFSRLIMKESRGKWGAKRPGRLRSLSFNSVIRKHLGLVNASMFVPFFESFFEHLVGGR